MPVRVGAEGEHALLRSSENQKQRRLNDNPTPVQRSLNLVSTGRATELQERKRATKQCSERAKSALQAQIHVQSNGRPT